MRTFFIPIFFLLSILSIKAQTVWDLIANASDLDTMEAALVTAQLDARLNDTLPVTVFAPTDSAFSLLPDGLLDQLLADTSRLGPLLRQHWIADSLSASDLLTLGSIPSVNGYELDFSMDSTGIYVNNVRIIVQDLFATNGVLHVIDAVFPLPADTSTVLDVIRANGQLTTMDSLLTVAGLDNALDGPGPITCFAPTNAAFSALSPESWNLITDSSGYLEDLLNFHLVSDSLTSSELSDGLTLTTWLGDQVQVTVDSAGIIINGASIQMADLIAGNGVVHLIDAVWDLPQPDSMLPNIVEVVAASAQHTLLDSALIASGYYLDLSAPGPFTLFAPTDGAFTGLSVAEIDSLFADPTGALRNVIAHHIIAGNLSAAGLIDGQTLTTMAGDLVVVMVDSSGIYIDNARIVQADLEASNGVVHAIDAVLLPEVMEPDTTTVWDVVMGRGDLTTFSNALQSAGLDDDLQTAGPFTVFAPSDTAFNSLLPGVLDSLNADPSGALANVLRYHLVAGQYLSGDFSNGSLITLQGQPVNVQVIGNTILINNVTLTVQDLQASNGVVHVLEAVLIPPAVDNSVTLVDMLENSPMHQTLLNELNLAGLNTTLDGTGPLTLFAPSDTAFAHLPSGFLDSLNADPFGDLTDFLSYHVLNGEWRTTDFSNGQTLMTLSGDSVTIFKTDSGVYVNQSLITMANIQTDNGILHYLDGVLMAPVRDTTTILDVINQSPDLQTLSQAVVAAGLEAALQGSTPLTVFAPTDAAFALLPDGMLDALLADPATLSSLLMFHAAAGLYPAASLTDGLVLTSLQGSALNISVTDSVIMVNDARIVMSDLTAGNGIVHVIDAVLMLPEDTTTVMDLIRRSPVHQGLESALDDAGLSMTLEGEGPYTVFAPTDSALAKVPTSVLLGLLADPAGGLREVLRHHIVNGRYLQSDFDSSQQVVTLNGDTLTVRNSMDSFLVDNALITLADQEATNGVLHVINAVLLLPMTQDTFTVVDAIKASPVHRTLDSLLQITGLDQMLEAAGPFTVFAPTDQAFGNVPANVMDSLRTDPQGLLRDVLLYHVLNGEFRTGNLMNGASEMTLQGQDVQISVNAQGLMINQASVTFANILTDNGVVHVIDRVLLPEGTVAIQVVDAAERGIRIYPNPVQDQINITWPLDWKNGARLELFNQMGQQVGSWSGHTGSQILPVKALPSGSYVLRICQGELLFQQRILLTH